MPEYTDPIARPELRRLLETVVSMVDWPAAVVADGEDVLASNALWRELTGSSHDSDESLSLEFSLRDFSHIDSLIESLRNEQGSVGMKTSRLAAGEASADGSPHDYIICWRQLYAPSLRHYSLAIVTLQDRSDIKRPSRVIVQQQIRIDRLLVRQTLIEEAERRKLGRALHDVVVQDLAQVRAAVRSSARSADDSTTIIASIDRIINEVRTLTFELGPPILEDLGLRHALQWLADHLNNRYSAAISVVDDACDPRLPTPIMTIIFRAVREVAINAAKHAPDSEIGISCVTNHRNVRIIVRDTGPGFDIVRMRSERHGVNMYGLLSVEQQIRGIGGEFDIVSEIGAGTRVTITAPTTPEKGAQHE